MVNWFMHNHGYLINNSRRGFFRKAALGVLGSYLGSNLIFGKNLPDSVLVELLKQLPAIPGKHPDLIVLNDRPWNVETPAHLLDEPATSPERLFVRNNGSVPQQLDPTKWTLEIGGESVIKPAIFTLDQLKSEFRQYTLQLTLECAGNGRAEFNPPAQGNQWTIGAVGCPRWTGIRLKDLLQKVGLSSDARYIGYYGRDTHLSGDPNRVVISRGVPMTKAMEDESLVAWAIDGKELPAVNGFPLRLVFGGWPASTSGKWLYKIAVRNIIHDGPKMEGQSYRVPCEPVAPGSTVADENMCIIESMPVKSLITYPKSGAIIKQGKTLEVRGHAWAGDLPVTAMESSIDFGSTWHRLELDGPVNRLAWQNWRGQVSFPWKGYYEVWARAIDKSGKSQPMILPGWNPRGYLNNACHRIAVKVT